MKEEILAKKLSDSTKFSEWFGGASLELHASGVKLCDPQSRGTKGG